MPYPNEHSCRLRSPDDFQKGSFRRIKRKDLSIVIGRPKGQTTTEAQAYRYPIVADWTESRARAHCKEAGGSFEAASKEEKAVTEITLFEIGGQMVTFEDLEAAYKAESGRERRRKGKATSLDDLSNMVRNAWYARFQKVESVPAAVRGDIYVEKIFSDKVIVSTAGGFLAYPYTVTEDGVEFGEPVKVELEYRPIGEGGKSLSVKFLREEDGGAVVGGHIALWGDADRKDLQGDFFTKSTELWLDKYQTVPALFHHGLDDAVGLSVIGRRIKSGVDDVGAWVEDWLDKSSKYWAMVQPLLDAEALYYSPGSAPHLIKRGDDGELLSYPIVEDTLTLIPAQHRLRPVEQIKAAYKAAGLDWPESLAGGGDDTGVPCQEAVAKARAEIDILLTEIEMEE